ncbi:MAG: YggS family pyridoxal phosphate-dependent enzyme [Proteobacteria bacterium]|nr:YggS family pyridoxal phosphate-dependent enzyme [Pseudomonadota bacterium]MBU1739263.1 YggS family pyridoxal phosphate-dependent enzyme [Pseudomonadota bacterium]
MIKENLEKIRERIGVAARRVGRSPEEVRLVAVSKRKPPELIHEAYDCGQEIFAENYFQEAREKIEILNRNLQWHFIGHLQSNKAAAAATLFDMIETVDRLKLAGILDKSLEEKNRILPVLVQVNIGDEPQKSGIKPEDAEAFFRELNNFTRLQVKGLMIMPPYSDDAESSRPYFRAARELAEKLVRKGLLGREGAVELSMGMSADYEVAIEEGATLVRVGTALFGSRN